MVNYFTKHGKHYLESTEDDGTILFTSDDSYSVVDGVQYKLSSDAPKPFVYGVKKVVVVYSEASKYQKYYDVKLGKFLSDSKFKGKKWVETIKTLDDTLTPRINYLKENNSAEAKIYVDGRHVNKDVTKSIVELRKAD